MIVLGHVRTDLGTIELDYADGIFTTSRHWHDALTGKLRYTIIPEDREDARWWYDRCAEHGATFGDFPDLSPLTAAPERTSA